MIRQILFLLLTVQMCMMSDVIAQSAGYAYEPAMYTSIAGVSQELVVFPFEGQAHKISLPFPLGIFAFADNGRALYATPLYPNATLEGGVFRIDLASLTASVVPGTIGVHPVGLAVVNQRKAILLSVATRRSCKLIEVGLVSGATKTVIEDSHCEPSDLKFQWTGLSVSPDGRRAVALRQAHLEMIDLDSGATRTLDGLIQGTWSPDGKWLAAIEEKKDETILLDATSLVRKKILEGQALRWSPDARYLLNGRSSLVKCGLGEVQTLETIEVATNKRTDVRSSACLVDRNTIGWVAADIDLLKASRP